MAFLKLVLVGFVLLSVIYVCIALYSRSVRREKLENAWAEENPDGSLDDRRAFVEAGMEAYHKSLRPKLILLVYVVPVAAVGVILWLTNY